MWKGIINNNYLVEKVACYAIGDGKSVNIWSDPGIPSMQGFKPATNPSLNTLPHNKNANLISTHNRSWEMDKLNMLFDADSVSHIQKLNLSQFATQDT
jgi:hypothetical protein